MASASKSTTLGNNAGSSYKATLTASFNENSTSIANNTSSITVTATQKTGNFDWSSSYTSTLKIYWYDNNANSGGKLVATTNAKSQGRNATITATGTITVPHKADGSLNGYAKAVWTKAGNSSWTPNSGNVSTNTTALTNIPRAATITAAPNFNDTDNPTISYSNPAGSAVASLQACIANSAGTVVYAQYRDISISGTSYTFNLTDAERNALRQACANSKTLAVKFYVTTVIGGNTYYSTLDRTMTVVNANPTFSAAYLDANSTTTAITENNQQIIRNQSTLRINITNAAAYKYATLASVSCAINGETYSETFSGSSCTINVGTVNVSSNTTATVTVTDSRGNSTSQSLAIQVLDWQLPTAIITAERQSHYYTPTNLTVDANYSSLDSRNSVTIQYRAKRIGNSPNLFDLYALAVAGDVVIHPAFSDGLTVSLNDEGSLTVSGSVAYSSGTYIVAADEMTMDPLDITSLLEDGETYTLAQSSSNNSFYAVVEGIKADSSGTDSWTSADGEVSFTVDKTTYSEYGIYVWGVGFANIDATELFTLEKGTSEWSNWASLQDNVTTVVNLDNEYSWEVQIQVSDRLGTTTYNIVVPRGMPIMYIDRLLSSVGFNCFPTNEGSVEVNGQNVFKSVMTRYLTANITNPSTDAYTQINLSGTNSFGTGLTATIDGGIKIGANVSKILISGRMLVSSSVVGSQYLRICRNNSSNLLGWVSHTNTSTSAAFSSIDITPALVNVTEGDVIYMYYYVESSSDTIYGQSTGMQTSITVETVG